MNPNNQPYNLYQPTIIGAPYYYDLYSPSTFLSPPVPQYSNAPPFITNQMAYVMAHRGNNRQKKQDPIAIKLPTFGPLNANGGTDDKIEKSLEMETQKSIESNSDEKVINLRLQTTDTQKTLLENLDKAETKDYKLNGKTIFNPAAKEFAPRSISCKDSITATTVESILPINQENETISPQIKEYLPEAVILENASKNLEVKMEKLEERGFVRSESFQNSNEPEKENSQLQSKRTDISIEQVDEWIDKHRVMFTNGHSGSPQSQKEDAPVFTNPKHFSNLDLEDIADDTSSETTMIPPINEPFTKEDLSDEQLFESSLNLEGKNLVPWSTVTENLWENYNGISPKPLSSDKENKDENLPISEQSFNNLTAKKSIPLKMCEKEVQCESETETGCLKEPSPAQSFLNNVSNETSIKSSTIDEDKLSKINCLLSFCSSEEKRTILLQLMGNQTENVSLGLEASRPSNFMAQSNAIVELMLTEMTKLNDTYLLESSDQQAIIKSLVQQISTLQSKCSELDELAQANQNLEQEVQSLRNQIESEVNLNINLDSFLDVFSVCVKKFAEAMIELFTEKIDNLLNRCLKIKMHLNGGSPIKTSNYKDYYKSFCDYIEVLSQKKASFLSQMESFKNNLRRDSVSTMVENLESILLVPQASFDLEFLESLCTKTVSTNTESEDKIKTNLTRTHSALATENRSQTVSFTKRTENCAMPPPRIVPSESVQSKSFAAIRLTSSTDRTNSSLMITSNQTSMGTLSMAPNQISEKPNSSMNMSRTNQTPMTAYSSKSLATSFGSLSMDLNQTSERPPGSIAPMSVAPSHTLKSNAATERTNSYMNNTVLFTTSKSSAATERAHSYIDNTAFIATSDPMHSTARISSLPMAPSQISISYKPNLSMDRANATSNRSPSATRFASLPSAPNPALMFKSKPIPTAKVTSLSMAQSETSISTKPSAVAERFNPYIDRAGSAKITTYDREFQPTVWKTLPINSSQTSLSPESNAATDGSYPFQDRTNSVSMTLANTRSSAVGITSLSEIPSQTPARAIEMGQPDSRPLPTLKRSSSIVSLSGSVADSSTCTKSNINHKIITSLLRKNPEMTANQILNAIVTLNKQYGSFVGYTYKALCQLISDHIKANPAK